jgi:hypothetical protein
MDIKRSIQSATDKVTDATEWLQDTFDDAVELASVITEPMIGFVRYMTGANKTAPTPTREHLVRQLKAVKDKTSFEYRDLGKPYTNTPCARCKDSAIEIIDGLSVLYCGITAEYIILGCTCPK